MGPCNHACGHAFQKPCTDQQALAAVCAHFKSDLDHARAFARMTMSYAAAPSTCFILEHCDATLEFIRRWSRTSGVVEKQMAMRMWVAVANVEGAAGLVLHDTVALVNHARVGMALVNLPGRPSTNALNCVIEMLCATAQDKAVHSMLETVAEQIVISLPLKSRRAAAVRAGHFGVAAGYIDKIPVVEDFLANSGLTLFSRTANIEATCVDVVVAAVEAEKLPWRRGIAAIAGVVARQDVRMPLSEYSVDTGYSPLAKFVVNFGCYAQVWDPDDEASAAFGLVLRAASKHSFGCSSPYLNDHTPTTMLLRAVIDAYHTVPHDIRAKTDVHAAKLFRECQVQPRTTMFHVADYKLAAKLLSIGAVSVGMYVVADCIRQTLMNKDKYDSQRLSGGLRWHLRHVSIMMIVSNTTRNNRVEDGDMAIATILRKHIGILDVNAILPVLKWTVEARLYDTSAVLLLYSTRMANRQMGRQMPVWICDKVKASCVAPTRHRALTQAAIFHGIVPYVVAVPPYASAFVTFSCKAQQMDFAWTNNVYKLVRTMMACMQRGKTYLPKELVMHVAGFLRYTDTFRAAVA